MLAYELVIATPAVRALLREGKTYQIMSVMQTGAREGMVTMDAYLAGLYRRRLITHDTGMERAVDSKEFARLASDPAAGNAASASLSPNLGGSLGMGGGQPQRPTATTIGTPSVPSGNPYGRR